MSKINIFCWLLYRLFTKTLLKIDFSENKLKCIIKYFWKYSVDIPKWLRVFYYYINKNFKLFVSKVYKKFKFYIIFWKIYFEYIFDWI